jgi:hypothetical protein
MKVSVMLLTNHIIDQGNVLLDPENQQSWIYSRVYAKYNPYKLETGERTTKTYQLGEEGEASPGRGA